MTNRGLRAPARKVGSPPGVAAALLGAALGLLLVPCAVAQEDALEVTLRVLDDVSAIEGVLMPLEEEPEHGTDADSAPEPENPPPRTEENGAR